MNADAYVNLKVYFHNDVFFSNAIDVFGGRISGRITSNLVNLSKMHGDSMPINSIKLFLDESWEYGSLIINDFIDVEFSKQGKDKKKKKFYLTGITTDYGFPLKAIGNEIRSSETRRFDKKFSFSHALKKFNGNPAIKDLAICVVRNFPHAISPIEGKSPKDILRDTTPSED